MRSTERATTVVKMARYEARRAAIARAARLVRTSPIFRRADGTSKVAPLPKQEEK